jgi:hypothetical protein
MQLLARTKKKKEEKKKRKNKNRTERDVKPEILRDHIGPDVGLAVFT